MLPEYFEFSLPTRVIYGIGVIDHLADALAPQLEGRDLQLTGVVAAMPQSRETGLRLRVISGAEEARYAALGVIAGQPDACVSNIILAYEPRWAISAVEAASPDYVAERHRSRCHRRPEHFGGDATRSGWRRHLLGQGGHLRSGNGL